MPLVFSLSVDGIFFFFYYYSFKFTAFESVKFSHCLTTAKICVIFVPVSVEFSVGFLLMSSYVSDKRVFATFDSIFR